YPCGAAAISNAILSFVSAGDHVLMTGSAYEPAQSFCDKILSRMSITTTYFDPMIGAGIAALITPQTKVVFLESPGSITMEIQDIPAMVRAIRAVAPEMIIMMDNTWAAGVLFKALD
ncbi:PLP-dependent transferase, partial [Yersinia bercovieri]|uniref:PLP-dependent transferase n=1 Tax=Yersinia bercovieri TaxID=634 RepID=UPI0016437297